MADKELTTKRDKYLNPQTNKGDNSKYLRHALAAFDLPPIDISDPEQVKDRIMLYFHQCIEDDSKPSITGMCNFLGISRMTFYDWQKRPSAERKEHQKVAVRAKSILEEMYEQYLLNGKINPVSGIFLMKNNFEGYYDKQEVVLTPNNPLDPQKTQKELEEQYYSNDVEDLDED